MSEMSRWLNDKIWDDLYEHNGHFSPVPFFCECGHPSCFRSVWFTLPDFGVRRLDPEWAAIAPEHAATADLRRAA